MSRNIPSAVKREVRKKSGFGCVVCGGMIYTYEHIDPPFADAKEHAIDGITLLCYQCQGEKSAGFMAAETVRAAMESPRCLEQGFASKRFRIGSENFFIRFAGQEFWEVPCLLVIDGIPILRIEKPEMEGAPFRLSAEFRDKEGRPSFLIMENEFKAYADNWDVETSGGTILVRNRKNDIGLNLKIEPPNRFIVQSIRALYGNVLLVGNADTLILINNVTGKIRTILQRNRIHHCPAGIVIETDSLDFR